MIAPSQVNPTNFPVQHILYEEGDDGFAIAWGAFDRGPERLGMRWSGEAGNPDDIGYPKVFGNPMWFVLPEALSVPILKALVGIPSGKQAPVLQVLEVLRTRGALEAASPAVPSA